MYNLTVYFFSVRCFFVTTCDSSLTQTGLVSTALWEIMMRRLERSVGALSHKMTRNQMSFLDLVGGLSYFQGQRQGGSADVTVRWWLQRRAMRHASSGPPRPLRATEEVVSGAVHHHCYKSQIRPYGLDDYSQCHHVNPNMPLLFVFQLPGLSTIYVECWLSCTSLFIYFAPLALFSCGSIGLGGAAVKHSGSNFPVQTIETMVINWYCNVLFSIHGFV